MIRPYENKTWQILRFMNVSCGKTVYTLTVKQRKTWDIEIRSSSGANENNKNSKQLSCVRLCFCSFSRPEIRKKKKQKKKLSHEITHIRHLVQVCVGTIPLCA